MHNRTPHLDVIVEDGTPQQDQEAIREYLERHGMSASLSTTDIEDFRQGISAVVSRFDPGVTGPYGANGNHWGVLLHAHVNDLVRDCGAENLRDAVDGLRHLRAKQTGSSPGKGMVMLIDEDTGIRLDMDFQLPLNAYQVLEGMRLATFEADPIRFHRKSGPNGRWRSPR
jgi:hypothetical protein